jgi:serine O-acetyltransferase
MEPEYFWSAWRADLDRHFVYHPGASALARLRFALALDGCWAMAVYRFGRRLRTVPPHPFVAPLLWALYRVAEVVLGVLTSISIDVDARIGPGLYVGHFVSLRIGPGVRIGRNCSVGQMCTIEGTGPDPATNAPVLGERVYLGSGAKVIGPLRIADGAAICANSVVAFDVPENGVVLGIPGIVISRRGSGDFIYLGEGTGVCDELPPEVQVTLSTG